jgi:regulator of RNase E activity RraA
MSNREESFEAEAITYLASIPTGYISDALGKIELWFQTTVGILPLRGFEDHKVGGPVATVKFAPMRNAMAASRKMNFFSFLAALPPGSVICVEGGADTAVHGDNQTDMCKRAGAAALISEGGSRDLSGLREVGLPVWAQGPALRGGRTKWELVSFNEVINLGGVRVYPGDYIFADECGCVVVPKEHLARVYELTKQVDKIEADLVAFRNDPNKTPEDVAALYAKKSEKAKDAVGGLVKSTQS